MEQSQNGWIKVEDRSPERGQEVLVYWYEPSLDLEQMHKVTYYRKGDIVEDEVIYEGSTKQEVLLDMLFGKRGEKTIKEDGFYIYDSVDYSLLCKWRKHSDCITHWMPLPAAPERIN